MSTCLFSILHRALSFQSEKPSSHFGHFRVFAGTHNWNAQCQGKLTQDYIPEHTVITKVLLVPVSVLCRNAESGQIIVRDLCIPAYLALWKRSCLPSIQISICSWLYLGDYASSRWGIQLSRYSMNVASPERSYKQIWNSKISIVCLEEAFTSKYGLLHYLLHLSLENPLIQLRAILISWLFP